MLSPVFRFVLLFTILTLFWCNESQAELLLRDNLKRAQKGDFIVTAQNKAYTVFHIYDRTDSVLTIEEITVPTGRIPQNNFSWREWVRQGAPCQTNWILYKVLLATGQIQECYSVSKNGWYDMAQADNFLPTLLNLKLTRIPESERKKVGPQPSGGGGPDFRKIWQPKMVLNGVTIPGVKFEAWRTHWPKDTSELSGKTIEVYIPEENEKYPSYFPYWLQIRGTVGAATLRIVDSGSGLVSPAKPTPKR